jgi:predicted secreted protein
VSKADDLKPQSLRLAPGEEHVLQLPARGSAGYDWWEEIEGQPGVVEIRRESAPRPAPPPRDRQPRTSSNDTLIFLRALQPGQATVTLNYKRPSQDNQTLETLRFIVEVEDTPMRR